MTSNIAESYCLYPPGPQQCPLIRSGHGCAGEECGQFVPADELTLYQAALTPQTADYPTALEALVELAPEIAAANNYQPTRESAVTPTDTTYSDEDWYADQVIAAQTPILVRTLTKLIFSIIPSLRRD